MTQKQAPAHPGGGPVLTPTLRSDSDVVTTCGDGAVSGVVVKSVEVFAALWAEIQRAWSMQRRNR